MVGLLDHIFDNIDIQNLDRGKVDEYATYLKEINNQNLPLDKKVKFLLVRVRLQQRLIQLDICQNIFNHEFISYKKKK
ncbi:hypothetical protein HUW51_14420 [Adhaeribacter swui]|uniref:Uncharacterized protein n=1 Tax=Adhaeribacter swui TaxID=2086471 RepID=A0A7G7G9M3_9BACT|nr:hypothetical protein [Adhaeribacter swui]QNF33857.1 hypothetical protein HUW51_14420 [Adhaeribacter swui]